MMKGGRWRVESGGWRGESEEGTGGEGGEGTGGEGGEGTGVALYSSQYDKLRT